MSLVSPKFDVRGKVKVGEKSDRGFPTSVDYFVCDDPEFTELYQKPDRIRVLLPYADPAMCFVQTLEAWKGSVLACRSNDGKVAYRKTDEQVGDGTERFLIDADPVDVVCLHRACPWFLEEKNGCRTTARLRFFLADGSNRSAVLEFVTHGYGSIAGIGAAMGLGARLGDLTMAAGWLSVQMNTKGSKRFPVVKLELDGGQASDVIETDEVLKILRVIGEIDNPDFTAWVRRVGAETALVQLRRHPRYEP
jgi:hypothetical protein